MKLNNKTIGISLISLAVILGLVLIIVKINFDSQAVFLCEAVGANPDIEMKDCPAHKSTIPWLLIIAFGISFVLLVVGFYLFFARTKELQQEPKKIDLSQLGEDEGKVYLFLKQKGGSAYQSEIIRETQINKVKMTRILDSMEHDLRLVERKRRGMANLVVLK